MQVDVQAAPGARMFATRDQDIFRAGASSVDGLSAEQVGALSVEPLAGKVEIAIRYFTVEVLDEDDPELRIARIQSVIKCFQQVATKNFTFMNPRQIMTVLDEIMDSLDIEECRKLFDWIEPNCVEWLRDVGSIFPRSYMFSIFQGLLRRLSPQTNAEFRGRVRNFISSIIPPNNITGLNDKAETNPNYKLSYKTDVKDSDILSQPGDPITISGMFYKNLWGLLETIHAPDSFRVQLARPAGLIEWTKLNKSFDQVLRIFEHSAKRVADAYDIKREPEREARRSRRAQGLPDEDVAPAGPEDDGFFLTYLTEPRLLPLEMLDHQFRRQVLCEMYFFIHSLVVPGVPSYYTQGPTGKSTLVEEPSTVDPKAVQQIGEILKRVRNQLVATPTVGKKVVAQLDQMLARDDLRIDWKLAKCPILETPIEFLHRIFNARFEKKQKAAEEAAQQADLKKGDGASSTEEATKTTFPKLETICDIGVQLAAAAAAQANPKEEPAVDEQEPPAKRVKIEETLPPVDLMAVDAPPTERPFWDVGPYMRDPNETAKRLTCLDLGSPNLTQLWQSEDAYIRVAPETLKEVWENTDEGREIKAQPIEAWRALNRMLDTGSELAQFETTCERRAINTADLTPFETISLLIDDSFVPRVKRPLALIPKKPKDVEMPPPPSQSSDRESVGGGAASETGSTGGGDGTVTPAGDQTPARAESPSIEAQRREADRLREQRVRDWDSDKVGVSSSRSGDRDRDRERDREREREKEREREREREKEREREREREREKERQRDRERDDKKDRKDRDRDTLSRSGSTRDVHQQQQQQREKDRTRDLTRSASGKDADLKDRERERERERDSARSSSNLDRDRDRERDRHRDSTNKDEKEHSHSHRGEESRTTKDDSSTSSKDRRVESRDQRDDREQDRERERERERDRSARDEGKSRIFRRVLTTDEDNNSSKKDKDQEQERERDREKEREREREREKERERERERERQRDKDRERDREREREREKEQDRLQRGGSSSSSSRRVVESKPEKADKDVDDGSDAESDAESESRGGGGGRRGNRRSGKKNRKRKNRRD